MQLNASDHRIYQHLGKPFRMMGLTMDELLLVCVSFIMIFVSGSMILQGVFALTGTVGLYLVKKLKKRMKSFSMPSFLHWYVGLMPKSSLMWPRSHNRFWLS